MEETILNKSDFSNFRQWLNLDDHVMAWEGKYHSYIDHFWGSFFLSGQEIRENIRRFDFAISYVNSGPVVSWLEWLKKKFVIFLFIEKNLNIFELSTFTDLEDRDILRTLRDFYRVKFPEKTSYFNIVFQISPINKSHLKLNFDQLSKEHPDLKKLIVYNENNYQKFELTLFRDWRDFIDLISENNKKKSLELLSLEKEKKKKKRVNIIKEISILLLVSITAIVFLRYGNQFYEKYILNQIQIFEPNFFWLDKSLSFKIDNSSDKDKKRFRSNQIEVLEKEEKLKVPENTQRVGPESEFVLTSIENISPELGILDYSGSEFEENLKGGMRDLHYGTRKAYRLIINTVSVDSLISKINNYMLMYKISRVDKVKPGTKIPGGAYYNLNVPANHIKEFITKVSDIEQTSIYSSKSWGKNPPGYTRVFIWIKSL